MGNLFNLDNPVWRFMGKLVDVCILTLLWFVCSLPIVTIGPATTAVYYVTLKLVRDEESYTVRSFFKSFKENFKQGAIIGIIMTLLGIFFVYDIFAYFTMGTQVMTILGILFIGVFLMYLFTLIYVYPLQAKFYNTVFRTMRNALFMSVKHVFRSLLMFVIMIAVMIGVLFFPPLLLLSTGLIAFLQSYLLVRIFDLYIPKEETEEKSDDISDSIGIEETEEPVHIVMSQEDMEYGAGGVVNREMLENKPSETEKHSEEQSITHD